MPHLTTPASRAPSGALARQPFWTLLAALLSALVLAGCGTDGGGAVEATGEPAAAAGTGSTDGPESTDGTPTSPAFPVEVEADNGVVEIPEEPERIVSMSPTGTEMLFAVGAGDQVVAVDEMSTYPAEAPTTKLSGFRPNAEAVLGYDPDLVVVSDDIDGIVGRLESFDLPVLHLGAADDLEETYAQIEKIGAATGNPDQAEEVVEDMQERMEEILADTPQPEEPLSVYHEVDPSLYSATSDTFIGSIYESLGLENIADAASTGGNDYPQLNPEAVVAANPDLIVLADTVCCGQSAATLAERPGWSEISAVRNGAVVEADDDIASRWGPRVVELAEQVAEEVQELASVPAS